MPFVAPFGTVATMLVALQLVGVADTPLNATMLVPCDAPKLVPVIVTGVPTGPLLLLRLVMLGDVTVKFTPLLATGPSLTTTFPVVAPVGTRATMLVWLQLINAAGMPLKETVLVPCAGPKFVPVRVTEVPAVPDVGFKLVIVTGVTVKLTLLLTKPPTVTTTGPVVAPVGTDTVIPVSIQSKLFCIVACVPLNVTVSPGTNVPKFVPKIDTDIPTGPEFG